MIVIDRRVSSAALIVADVFEIVTWADAPPVPPVAMTRWSCCATVAIVRSSVEMVVPEPAVTATLSAMMHRQPCVSRV